MKSEMDTKQDTSGILNVLSLEDSVRDFEIIREQLVDAGYNLNISRVDTEIEFASSLRLNSYDIILADFNLPGYDAFAALRLCKEICPDVPFICISGSIGEETAIELIKEGAVDYVLKDRPKRLPLAVKRALDEAKEKQLIRKAEEKLRDSELNYRTLADSGQAMIWVSGTDKLCNYFNRVWLSFTGRTLQQEVGNGWTEGVHPEDLAGCLEIYLNAFDRREIFSEEYRLKRHDGEFRWIIDEGCPRYDINGQFIGYIGHCLDITARKQAEAEILKLNETLEQRVEERTRQLLDANNELEAFSYSVSHDLRAPLRGIHGFTQILLEDYVGKLDNEGKRVCAVIQENSQKMGNLIDDLLAFSRLNRTTMTVSLVNMKELVNSIYHELANPVDRDRITLDIEDLCQAPADPVMIRQTWTNLLSNAIKYSSKREKAIISVSSKPGKGKCIYCIRDNGAGFDMHYVSKIFGVFQRLHSEKEFEGTGVGLAIVQRIVRRHGGEIWAEGEVDKGAAFYFTLPVIA
jgi:PAS domain S-box-containing protein